MRGTNWKAVTQYMPSCSPTLSPEEGDPSASALECAGECAKLTEACKDSFKDLKSKHRDLKTFAAPLNLEQADAPKNLRHKAAEHC